MSLCRIVSKENSYDSCFKIALWMYLLTYLFRGSLHNLAEWDQSTQLIAKHDAHSHPAAMQRPDGRFTSRPTERQMALQHGTMDWTLEIRRIWDVLGIFPDTDRPAYYYGLFNSFHSVVLGDGYWAYSVTDLSRRAAQLLRKKQFKRLYSERRRQTYCSWANVYRFCSMALRPVH